jgi:hypothetical protein
VPSKGGKRNSSPPKESINFNNFALEESSGIFSVAAATAAEEDDSVAATCSFVISFDSRSGSSSGSSRSSYEPFSSASSSSSSTSSYSQPSNIK